MRGGKKKNSHLQNENGLMMAMGRDEHWEREELLNQGTDLKREQMDIIQLRMVNSEMYFKRNSTNQKSIKFSEKTWYDFMMLFWIIYQILYNPTFSAFPMRI